MARSSAIAANSPSVRERAMYGASLADRGALDGNGDHEHGAFRRVVQDAHDSVVAVDQPAHDRQAEPGAARFTRGARIDLVEGVEHAAALALRDANARVCHPELDGRA